MIIPNGAAQVNLKFTGAAVPRGAQCTFGVVGTEVDDPEEIATLVSAAVGTSALIGNCTPQLTMSSILVKMGPNETGPMAEIATNAIGGAAGEAVPPNTAVLFRKQTVQGGRRGSGRLFLPAIPEAAVSAGGMITQQYTQDLGTAAQKLLDELADHMIPMLLLHSTEGIGSLPLAVTKLSVQSKVATQRRRLR